MKIRQYALLLSLIVTVAPYASTQVMAQPASNAPAAQQPQSEYEKNLAAAKDAMIVKTVTMGASVGQEERYKLAARFYEKAAETAPDNAKKYDAYISAGQNYGYAKEPALSGAAYKKASEVAAITGAQKAQSLVSLADAARLEKWSSLSVQQRTATEGDKLRANYAAVLKVPGADKESRIHAQRYIGYLWQEQGEYLKGALAFEELSKWPELTKAEQLDALSGVPYVLGDFKPGTNPQAVQVLERVYGRMTTLETRPQQLASMYLKWGELLLKNGNKARAYAVWGSLADNTKALAYDRAQAIEKIASQRLADKQPKLALEAWERTKIWPQPDIPILLDNPPLYLNWAHRRAASRAQAYEALGDEEKFRAEVNTIIGIAKNYPPVIAQVRYEVAMSYQREIEKLRKSNPNPSTQIKTQIAAKEKAAATQYEAVINADKVSDQVRYEAALQRAQMEANAKNYVKARGWLVLASEKLKSKDQIFGPRNAYVLPLMKAVAKVAFAEKNYKDGVTALLNGLNYAGKNDNEGEQMIYQLWGAALQNKEWEQARSIINQMKANQLPDAEYYPAIARIEVGAQNWRAAAEAVAKAEKLTLNANQKTALADATAKIPADVLAKARTDLSTTPATPQSTTPQAATPPAATPPASDDAVGGFFWF